MKNLKDNFGELYSVAKTCEVLNIDSQLCYKWIKEGKLKAYKLAGTTYRISEKDLNSFIFGSCSKRNTEVTL